MIGYRILTLEVDTRGGYGGVAPSVGVDCQVLEGVELEGVFSVFNRSLPGLSIGLWGS